MGQNGDNWNRGHGYTHIAFSPATMEEKSTNAQELLDLYRPKQAIQLKPQLKVDQEPTDETGSHETSRENPAVLVKEQFFG